MASIIRIKRSPSTGNPSTLGAGELAYSALSNPGFTGGTATGGEILYIGVGTETSGNASTHDIIGGKYYTRAIDNATNINTASTLIKRDASGNFSAGIITATLSGSASTAIALTTTRTIALTGDATASGSFDGSANYSQALTLATVNSNIGSFGSSTIIPVLTVNSKGLVTAVSTSAIIAPAGTLSGITLNSTIVSSSLTSVGTITSGVWNGSTITTANGGTGTTTGSITGSGALTFTAGGTNTNVSLVPNGTGTVDVSNKRITNLADPTSAQDATTKAYVDAMSNGLDVKASVRAASTTTLTTTYSNGTAGVGATLTNAGTQTAFTLDSITLNIGDRVLIKDQATALQNGVYSVTIVGGVSTNWVLTRTTDFDNSPGIEVSPGTFFFVEEGATQQDNGYVVSTDSAIIIGSTAIAFSQFSGAGQITAGAGLTKTGSTFDVIGTTNRILINADSIDISASYVGQTSLTTLGTIGTGVWQGTVVGPTYGGTGVNNGSNTLTLAGNVSHAGAFTQTFTATANTSLTLPTTGTLATLAGTETLTNKTLSTGSTWNGNTVGVVYGGTGVTASSGANSVVLRDANQNITANSILEGYTSVAAAGTTTTLTVSSTPNYVVTGSGGQTFKLPDATTLTVGTNFFFNNNQSSGAITVQNSSATTVGTIQSGGYVEIVLLTNGGAAGTWDIHNYAPSNVSWSTNTLDYAGSITSATWNGTAVAPNRGGTGVANNVANTITFTGAFSLGLTLSANTAVTLPTTGTLATLAGTEALSNKTITASSFSGTTLAASGNVTFTSSTDATALGTAPVVLSGGLSVAKAIYVGTNITGAGAATSALDGFQIDGGTY